jgi:hypothetical protein
MSTLPVIILSLFVTVSASVAADADSWIYSTPSRVAVAALSAALAILLIFLAFAVFLSYRLRGPMAGLSRIEPKQGSRVKGFVAPGFEEVALRKILRNMHLLHIMHFLIVFWPSRLIL